MDRFEPLLRDLAAGRAQLPALIARVVPQAPCRLDSLSEQFAETDRLLREADARAQARGHELDARIDKLLVAIRQFMSQRN